MEIIFSYSRKIGVLRKPLTPCPHTPRDGGPAYEPTPQAPLPCDLFCDLALRKKTRRGVSGAPTLPFLVTKDSIHYSSL